MDPFKTDGWDYSWGKTLASVLAIALTLDLQMQGGKALGLKLAKFLADGTTAKMPNGFLHVPVWLSTNANPDMTHITHVMSGTSVIVRSSGLEEDWVDPRSGVDDSMIVYARTYSTIPFEQRLQETIDLLSARGPVVVQQYINGCGCVVDIGWSAILRRNVFRIAIGNKSDQGGGEVWTSATWDQQANVAVYDADTGESLVPFWNDGDPFIPTFSKMIPKITEALRAIGLRFAVQLELIIPDLAVPEWYLVQLRPSPEAIRGASETYDLSAGTLIATVGKVNQPGEVEADTVVLGSHDFHILSHASEPSSDPYFAELRARIENRIVLWEESDRYNRGKTVLGAGRLGAVGQIGEHHIIANSSHGTFSPIMDKEMLREARRQGVQIALDRNTLSDIKWTHRAKDEKPARLRLVSDGLVGQVYRVG